MVLFIVCLAIKIFAEYMVHQEEVAQLKQEIHYRDSVLNAKQEQIHDQEILIKTLTVQHEDDERIMKLTK